MLQLATCHLSYYISVVATFTTKPAGPGPQAASCNRPIINLVLWAIALRGIYESSALLPVQYLFVYGKLELFFLFFFLHSLTTIIKDTIISITILHRLEQKLLLLCTHAYLFGCGCFRCILGLVLRLGLGISFHRKTKFPHRA